MNRLIMSVVLLSASASLYAADLNNFSFYGSVKMGTWLDRNEKFLEDTMYANENDTLIGPDSRPDYHCNIVPHGKFGVNYKSDRIGATLELKVQTAITRAYLPGATTDHVSTSERYFAEIYRFFAEWYVNDYITLMIGQNYAPIGFLYSNQAFYDDNSFGNTGNLYGGRKPMLAVSIGNLKAETALGGEIKAAVLKTDTCSVLFANDQTPNTDWILPKFETSITGRLTFDPVTLNAKAVGGLQQYYLHRRVTKNPGGYHPDSQTSQRVDCWVAGAHGDVKICGFSLAVDFALGQNWGPYGLYIGNPFVYRGSFLSQLTDIFYPTFATNEKTGEYDQFNSVAMQGDIIGIFRATDWLAFEGGLGWVTAENPDPQMTLYWHDTYAAYFQAELKPIKPVTLTPEVGLYYYGPLKGYGQMLYAGFKSTVDF